MVRPPHDTSTESWAVRREAILAMDPSDRVRVAIELSEAVRELQIQGLLDRNLAWTRADAVAHLVERMRS